MKWDKLKGLRGKELIHEYVKLERETMNVGAQLDKKPKVYTEAEFEAWKNLWLDLVPKCRNFNCIHELGSCNVERMCGDCGSIYSTFNRVNWSYCNGVNCEDCTKSKRNGGNCVSEKGGEE